MPHPLSLSIGLLFLLSVYAHSQVIRQSIPWFFHPSGTTKNLNGLHFPDRYVGYAVGDSGVILKTTDGGIHWTPQSSGVQENLKAVFFPEMGVGIAVGDSGAILRTTNGGTTWSVAMTAIYALKKRPLASVGFSDFRSGYVVGARGGALKTADGGVTWKWVDINGELDDFKAVHFGEADRGYIVGASGTLLRTVDAGATWKALASKTTEDLVSIAIADTNRVCMSGNNGTLVWTMDGGQSWFAKDMIPKGHLLAIAFADSGYGQVMGANGTTFNTINFGGTWTQEFLGTEKAVRAVQLKGVNLGYAVGEGGLFLRKAENPLLEAPVLKTPAQSALVPLKETGTEVPLGWNSVPGAAFYQVQVSYSQFFTAYSDLALTDLSVTSLSRLFTGPKRQETYRWRIKAGNAEGTSPWSAIGIFSTVLEGTGVQAGPKPVEAPAAEKAAAPGTGIFYRLPGTSLRVDAAGRGIPHR